MLLRARVVLPVTAAPIENGAVAVRDGRIASVGTWSQLRRHHRGPVSDLGDVILMPGLVNAHCHLDYTHMAGQLPPPKTFSDWLKQITELKAGWDLEDYASSWKVGAAMLLRTGTTTVADVEAVPELLPGIWHATPLRIISFLEMIGITGRRTPAEILKANLELLKRLRAAPNGFGGSWSNRRTPAPRWVGLSPHAPYSTLPELLRLTAEAARRHGWRVATHVAESRTEYDMFCRGRGEMYRWMRRASRDMSDCGSGTPVQQLEKCGILGKHFIAVHANYLGRKDAGLLAARSVSVVHCPRSHFYFRHDPFPLRRLTRAGVTVALGTDSLASVYVSGRKPVALDMFEEMRALARSETSLRPHELLEMATTKGAKTLGLPGKIGELSVGASADVICLPFAGKTTDAHEAVLDHRGPVCGSMISGNWAIPCDAE